MGYFQSRTWNYAEICRPASMFSNVQLALDLVLQTYFLGRINGYVFIGVAWRSWQSLGVVAVLDACGFQQA